MTGDIHVAIKTSISVFLLLSIIGVLTYLSKERDTDILLQSHIEAILHKFIFKNIKYLP